MRDARVRDVRVKGNLPEFGQTRSQSPRYPCPAERENDGTMGSGITFRLNCAGVSVYFKMASNSTSELLESYQGFLREPR